MTTISVDAMGGDAAPAVEVEGAILAAREYDVGVLLVGREDVLASELARHDTAGLPIEIAHASEVIAMGDNPTQVLRKKRDSSIRVAARLVREGRAQGLISAGNTGAAMATSKIVLGVLPGVHRPALAQVFPTLEGTWAVLIDVGANVDCPAEMLAQFAIMGEVYSRVLCHRDNPRVGLLSIGEEEHKGNEQTRAATPLLKELPLDFIGNVEGRDLYSAAGGRRRLRRLHRQRRSQSKRRSGQDDQIHASRITRSESNPQDGLRAGAQCVRGFSQTR